MGVDIGMRVVREVGAGKWVLESVRGHSRLNVQNRSILSSSSTDTPSSVVPEGAFQSPIAVACPET